VEKLNVSDRDKLSLVFLKGQGALRGDDMPEKARAIFSFVNRLHISMEEKIEMVLAGSPTERFSWSDPLLNTANTRLTDVILNEFLRSLQTNDDAKLDVLSGRLPWKPHRDLASVGLGGSVSEGAESINSGTVETAFMLNRIPEEYAGKAKLVIDFVGKLKLPAAKKAEGLMRYYEAVESMPPLGIYLKEGNATLVCEFVDAVLEGKIFTNSEEDRDKKVEVLLARHEDGKPGVIHALDNNHIGTALQYRTAILQSRSLVKAHPDMVAVLAEINIKASLEARGKRKASSTMLLGAGRAAPASRPGR
jgi:hypothetical protein